MNYPYSAYPNRGKLTLPGGCRLGLIMTINLEYWDLTKNSEQPYYAGGPAILPDPLPANVADFPNFMWREYGQRAGVWRLFEIFDTAKVPVSCTINAKTATERPEIVKAADSRGWEIVAHNYEQGELLTDHAHNREAEAEVIKSTLAVYHDVLGRPAKGWLSSSMRGTLNTCDILAEEGILFYCDFINDDQPYMINTSSGDLVSIPYSNEINDFTQLMRRGHTTDEFYTVLKDELDTLLSEAQRDDTAKIMNVGLHPHVAGRAYRSRAITQFLQYALGQPEVSFLTREAIAEHYLSHHESHIPA